MKKNISAIEREIERDKGNCDAIIAALAAIYVEMRRDTLLPGAAKNMGSSGGPGQIKADFLIWASQNDPAGVLGGELAGLTPNSREYHRKIYELIQENPILIASAGMRSFISQWSNAGFDVSKNPGILGTLYNIGPSKSSPKASPQNGGSEISYNDGTKDLFGNLAEKFSNSDFAKRIKSLCDNKQCPYVNPGSKPVSARSNDVPEYDGGWLGWLATEFFFGP